MQDMLLVGDSLERRTGGAEPGAGGGQRGDLESLSDRDADLGATG
jgi:hypothetical protein